jgi:hypothetical protein
VASHYATKVRGQGIGYTDGAQPAGKSVTTAGWTASATILKAGDWFAVAGRLRVAGTDVYADEDGKATVPMWPNVAATTGGQPLELLNPSGIFRLISAPNIDFDTATILKPITISAEEALS